MTNKITLEWAHHPRHRKLWVLLKCKLCEWEHWCANKSAAFGIAERHRASVEHRKNRAETAEA